MLQGKQILLIIAGGIAAYKSLTLIRRLQDQGAQVVCVLTAGGAQFVTPLSVAALSGGKVYQELFSLTDEAEMGHIRLSREADMIVVAPATADLISKMAHGGADDLASTLLLATDKPVLIAPAMNVEMWRHAATQRNIETLRGDGIAMIGPAAGDLACGETGPGRMVEAEEIVSAVVAHFTSGTVRAGELAGRRILITAGPTHEPIDPVRYIANRSSGKQGYALAAALAGLGAETLLVSGPTNLADPAGVQVIRIESAREMLRACQQTLPVDAVVCVAAVADWRTAGQADQKLKKHGNLPAPLELTENPDILKTLSGLPAGERPRLVVGFAAETEKIIEHAQAKLARKGCDWIVANDVSHRGPMASGVMGGDQNKVHIVSPNEVDSWPEMTKAEVAAGLARKIADQLGDTGLTTQAAQ